MNIGSHLSVTTGDKRVIGLTTTANQKAIAANVDIVPNPRKKLVSIAVGTVKTW